MKKILVICDYYLPSVNSGGGMWTVANLVERFADRYTFYILTRNYDSPGNTAPYTTVLTDEWNERDNCRVYYASNTALAKSNVAKLVKEVAPDCVLLNGAFATPVVRYLMAVRDGIITGVPVIVAPIGSFARGAMASKSVKKKLFLAYAKVAGLYRGVLWKASSELEAEEIRNIFGNDLDITIAPDLSPRSVLPAQTSKSKPVKKSGAATFIFLSRIVPKKNLRFLLERFRDIRDGTITLEIVGPQEDQRYWSECKKIIEGLPSNIKINVIGGVAYAEGLERLSDSHFFILPTLNENFGYVFLESLAAGCPIMISDQTVWGDVARSNAGWVIPLDDVKSWNGTIKKCVAMAPSEYSSMSAAARKFAQAWLADTTIEDATAALFEKAVGDRNV